MLQAAERKSEDEESSKSKQRRSAIIAPLVTKPKAAERLVTENQAPEHIGHMAITTEGKRFAVEGKRIETLNRAELLNLSEKIAVEGSTLRQIYETHLIGERGLRRLVAEHLHGGDLNKALRLEIIEREIDFERDPGLRDMAPVQLPSTNTAQQAKTALDELLERADIVSDDRGEEAAFFKARATYEANQLQQHKQQRRLIDIGLAVIITILLVLVLILYLG